MPKHASRLLAIVLALFAILAQPSAARADPGSWQALTAASAPTSNPLKGFMPFAPESNSSSGLGSDALPYSMEWFYLPVNAVVKGQGQYDWTALDSQLNAIAGRGHQAVFRLYLDYPGRDTGVPQYLIDAGIDTSRHYNDYGNNGKSFSPNYDDPRVKSMMLNLVSSLGQRYDGDPRIGFISQGLIGFWGEDHTYPMDGSASPENWMPGQETQSEVMEAWDAAFHTTHTVVRYPESWNAGSASGYNDDSFGSATLTSASWHFWSQLQAAGATEKWETEPIGGEVYPDIQSCMFSSDCAPDPIPTSIQQTHVSWLINQQAFAPGYSGDARNKALDSQAAMGYVIRPTETRISAEGGTASIGVRLKNDGVAPFYYSWPMEVALVDSAGKISAKKTLPGDLSAVLPGQVNEFSTEISLNGIPNTSYHVVMRVVNPLENGVPLKFAAAGQDQTLTGWDTLGTLATNSGSGSTEAQPTPSASVTPSNDTSTPIPTVTPSATTAASTAPMPSTATATATTTVTITAAPQTTPQPASHDYNTSWQTTDAGNTVNQGYGYGYGPGYNYGWGPDYAWASGDGWSYGHGNGYSYANGNVNWDLLKTIGHLLP